MSNVDPQELQKFGDLAHRWWDPNSEFKPLHQINPLRLAWIEEKSGGLTNKRVIDVGCGGGILSEAMARRGAQVKGIDLGDKALKVAQLHQLETQVPVEYECISAEAIAAREAGSYDIVTCMEMLEHVPDPASTVAACAALVKPGGHVFFSTINRNLKAYLFAVIGAEYVLKLLPKRTHDYTKFLKPSELAGFCRAHELDVRHTVGLTYNPLNKIYALDSDTDVNYMLHTVHA
ncbi:MAG TPA: bifunctional 2-polyprenyl-6-hydroxyphenol methylase/3-demethylubiquinol 3-O-methyltransferase UbiG [Burkholderiales bacterium]|nr:bifunctional 2-polyprenyl-6-hydroxyphenol methylase/3-demethylubiquinol 3-O-methyltransferase UbiG [Burkholderiales bacterium]